MLSRLPLQGVGRRSDAAESDESVTPAASPLAFTRASLAAPAGKHSASEAEEAIAWHTLNTAEEVYAAAGSSPLGLTPQESARRLAIYGKNVMTARGKRTMLQKIWEQVNSIIMYILIVSSMVRCEGGGVGGVFACRELSWARHTQLPHTRPPPYPPPPSAGFTRLLHQRHTVLPQRREQ